MIHGSNNVSVVRETKLMKNEGIISFLMVGECNKTLDVILQYTFHHSNYNWNTYFHKNIIFHKFLCRIKASNLFDLFDLILYIHCKQLKSCQGSQLLNHTVPVQASQRHSTSIKCPFFRQ